jgi:hypothetical protein
VHHLSPLLLHSGLAGTELGGNLLVETAGNDPAHDVTLTWSQRLITAAQLIEATAFGTDGSISLDGMTDGSQ